MVYAITTHLKACKIPPSRISDQECSTLERVRYLMYYFCSTELSSWTFVSDGGDVAVRVARRSGQECQETELSPLTRLGGYKEVQSDHILCQGGVTYIITFDNTHSLLRSKTINYTFVVDLMESGTGTGRENLSTSVTVLHIDTPGPGLTESQVIHGLRTGVKFTSIDPDPHIAINKLF